MSKACDHDWTVRIRDANQETRYIDPFEFRPIEMSLKLSRNQYDFCRVKAHWSVGEEMKPHTRFEGGRLRDLKPVEICHNGDVIQQLMFRPDWVDYGSEYTHLQFHDLQKALADGTVDIQRELVSLKKIYPEVINSAENRLIDEVKFTVPDNSVRTVYGRAGVVTLTNKDWKLEARHGPTAADETLRVIDSSYAVDFDQISPERALQKLNKMFRLKSWVNREGGLVVGLPEANFVRHVAAPRDDRVWRYKDPNISHGREPIRKVIVEGAWVDEPGYENNIASWFDEGGGADVKAMGIAERQDIDYGTVAYVSSTKAKKDALPHVATLTLKEKMKNQNAGTVEIDPEISGEQHTSPIDLATGDLIHLVPDDELFDNPTATSGVIGDSPDREDIECNGFVNNEAYITTEVEHAVTEDGKWQIHADLGMYPDVDIAAKVGFFDPKEERWVKDEEITEDSEGNRELKGAGLFDAESI